MDHVLLNNLLDTLHGHYVTSWSQNCTRNRIVQDIVCHCTFIAILLVDQGLLLVARIVYQRELDLDQFLHLERFASDRMGNRAVRFLQLAVAR